MRSNTRVFIFSLLFFCFTAGSLLFAQSTDKKNPTPIESPEISGISNIIGDGYWYKLTAGPGELIIEMEVQCWNRYQCESSLHLVLYGPDMKEVMNKSLSTEGRYTLRNQKATLDLKSKQDFLLSVTSGRGLGSSSNGTYIVRFKGSIDLPDGKK